MYTHAYISPRAILSPPPQERERERDSSGAARRMAPSHATGPIHRSCPIHPLFTAVPAPEDIERPVGRRREAHVEARGGANARRRQRRPGIGRRAEAVQVVEVGVCGGRRGTQTQGRTAAGGGRRDVDADEASRRAWVGVSEWALLYARGRPA
jgi:hypothetical protein